VIAQFERELVLVYEVKKFVGNLNIVGFLMDVQNVKQKIGIEKKGELIEFLLETNCDLWIDHQ
jgi:hypothetical protein